jgi:hypothetical protein
VVFPGHVLLERRRGESSLGDHEQDHLSGMGNKSSRLETGSKS